jgi:hypothetical protein
MLAALAQCTQLTSLGLSVMVWKGDQVVHCCDHALPVPGQLTQLRCLTVNQEVLLRDGGSCLAPLTQLTHLHVMMPGRYELRGWSAWHKAWARATETRRQQLEKKRQQLEEEFVAGLQQQLQQLQGWPASMQQVVLDLHADADVQMRKPRCWTFTLVGPGSGEVSVWLEQRRSSVDRLAPGWARPFHPCPHLPGVWELQGPASPAEP